VVLIVLFVAALTAFFYLLIDGQTLDSGGQLVKRGAIRVETNPGNADVFINNEKKNRTSGIIQNLEPGRALLSVQKEGFEDWSKEIFVDSEDVNEFNVTLLPEELNVEQFSTLNITNFAYSKNRDYAFFTVSDESDNELTGLWFISFKNNILSLSSEGEPKLFNRLNRTLIEKAASQNFEIIPATDGSNAILSFAEDASNYLINSSDITNLNTDLGFSPDFIDWFDEDELLIEYNNSVFTKELDSENKNLITILDNNEAYCLSKASVNYSKGNDIYRFENNSHSLIYSLSKDDVSSIECASNNNEALAVNYLQGFTYLNLEEDFESSSELGNIFRLSPDGLKLFDDSMSSIYKFKDNSTEDVLSESEIELENGSYNVYFSKTSNNLILGMFSSDGEIGSISVSDFDGQNLSEIYDSSNVLINSTSIQDEKEIYFVAKPENQSEFYNIYRVEID